MDNKENKIPITTLLEISIDTNVKNFTENEQIFYHVGKIIASYEELFNIIQPHAIIVDDLRVYLTDLLNYIKSKYDTNNLYIIGSTKIIKSMLQIIDDFLKKYGDKNDKWNIKKFTSW